MLSESARMTTAKEAAYRVPYANSKPRAAKIIALDQSAADVVDHVSRLQWNGAKFYTALSFSAASAPGATSEGMQAWLSDVTGRTMDLYTEIAESDFVVVVTSAGEDARAVTLIGDACNAHNKSLIGLIVPQPSSSEEDITRSLDHLRPHTRMLVVSGGEEYVEVMLTALRA